MILIYFLLISVLIGGTWGGLAYIVGFRPPTCAIVALTTGVFSLGVLAINYGGARHSSVPRVARQPRQGSDNAEYYSDYEDDGHAVDPIFKQLDLCGKDHEGRTFAELHAERCAADRANHYNALVSRAMGGRRVEVKPDVVEGKSIAMFYQDDGG